jgi:hypothetical protein
MKKNTKRTLFRVILVAAVAAGLVLVVVSRSDKTTEPAEEEQPAGGDNILPNGGFEEGDRAWQWLSWSKGWAPFAISRKVARTGSASALLDVSSSGDTRATIVWGVVQEIELPGPMPECLEGYYYVDLWQRGAAKQYLQAVIIDLSRQLKNGNAQMRYIISGVTTQPYNLGNAHYVFLDPARKTTPARKTWSLFKTNPKQDFEKNWGYVPAAGHRLRVLFEARFDSRTSEDPDARAAVHYDDLYLGPAGAGHCP